MSKTRFSLSLIAACLTLAYCAYTAVGYLYLSSRLAHLLVIYGAEPQLLPTGWRLLPFPRTLAAHALRSRDPEQVRLEFRDWHSTLYSALGYRSIYLHQLEDRPQAQVRLLKEMTTYLYNAGIGLDVTWSDPRGCTAVQEALLMRDSESVRFLLTLGKVDLESPNPQAKNPQCQMSIKDLATHVGLTTVVETS
jgi:hypothetical protein